MPDAPLKTAVDHRAVALLGLVTIAAYGTWWYAFGVLLDPIRLDTGWSESALATSFAIGSVTIGLGAIGGGRLIDRLGARRVLLVGSLGGGVGLLIAASATNIVVFFVSAAVGMGFFGALGFYHVTMTAAVQLHPESPARAIAHLTIWGAFASAIYLPATAWLVERFEWRTTVRLLAASAIVSFLLAAWLLPIRKTSADASPPPVRDVIAATLRPGAPRRLSTVVAMFGIGMSTVLVYQVPAMTAAGLALTTASTMAAVRGFCQLGGRLPIAALVRVLGVDRALLVACAALGVGGALLAFAGSIPTAALFAVVTGFGIGAYSPLQGIKAEQLYDRDTLGATLGFYGTVGMLAGAAGPAVVGFLADATDDRRWASVVTVIAAALAVAVLASQKAPDSAEPVTADHHS